MKPSEVCAVYSVQNCHVCDRIECGDNENPLVKKIKESEEANKAALIIINDIQALLESDRNLVIEKLNHLRKMFGPIEL